MTPRAPKGQVPGAGSPLTREVLTGPFRQATVLASFPTALYLWVGDHHEVLPVLAADALALPTGTRLSAPGREVVWGVAQGDLVTVGRSGIWLPGWRVNVVREWRPARLRTVSTLADPGLLSVLADQLCHHASTPVLVDQANAVCRAARRGDEAGVRAGVRRMLGAGQGLTPSGDDALCAVLLVLCGVGESKPIALLGAAVRDQWTRTTSLSASLLNSARGGYAVPQLVALVHSALSGNLAGVRNELTSTLAIGHWSGPDLVAGLAGSLRVLSDTRPNTAPAPFPAVKHLEAVPKRCSDRSLTLPAQPLSLTPPNGLRSLTHPNGLRSLTHPNWLRSLTDPSPLRPPTDPSPLRPPTDPSPLRPPTDPSPLKRGEL